MGNNPLVSIVTTCFNAEKTIERAIKSVLNQNYKNIEYIIIDACSNDNTKRIIDKYKTHLSYYDSQQDRGISDGWNKGIKKSKGEYIQILNADDYLQKDKVIESIKCFNNNPQASYVFGDLYIINNNNNVQYAIKGDEDYAGKIKYWTPRINHPTVMAKKNIFQKYGLFDKKYKIAMDYEWLLRVHTNGEVGIYSEKIITYMQEGGQSSNYFHAMKEEYDISVNYGRPKIVVFVIYTFRFFRTNIRKLLEKFVNTNFLYAIRKGINKQIK